VDGKLKIQLSRTFLYVQYINNAYRMVSREIWIKQALLTSNSIHRAILMLFEKLTLIHVLSKIPILYMNKLCSRVRISDI
jgi:hypothetical protein